MSEAEIIKHKSTPLSPRTAIVQPDFTSRTAIVSSRWEYIRFYLKKFRRGDNRRRAEKALFFWEQAEQFYNASLSLSKESAPLPLYYCFLNATKSLLTFKGISYDPWHGVTGNFNNTSQNGLTSLTATMKSRGVCPALSDFLGYQSSNFINLPYDIDRLFSNLVYLNRAYCISKNISHTKEMYIPLDDVLFSRKPDKRITISAKVDPKYSHITSLPKVDISRGSNESVFISWKSCREVLKPINAIKSEKIIKFHKKIRPYFHEISAGVNSRWYFKDTSNPLHINQHPAVIAFMSMHRLSEISRYDPEAISKHLDGSSSWIINEFITASPFQFINNIASEITGEQLGVSRYDIKV